MTTRYIHARLLLCKQCSHSESQRRQYEELHSLSAPQTRCSLRQEVEQVRVTRLLADSKAFHLIIELDISSRNWAGSEAQWREDLSQGRKWSCFVGWAPREDERSGWG